MIEDRLAFLVTFMALFSRIVQANRAKQGLTLTPEEVEQLYFCLDAFMGEDAE